ncbi:hypothetical protein CRU94_05470 [Arcobacter sp. AHV-9/2010]|uniref:hypothetical protein n=1 Tax=Arcobacter sp. AHV-9/2010 TaxID=2021861 RepID=UPI00100B4569|nr:hypothetical protein [Arcobacter sp. CECT 9299]RXJ96060.1 hypothetical protein CRU94_05470 [Arcobacter sp. CECT 9299]
MTNLTLSKKTAFEVTANKAHKLLESLKKYETFKTSNMKDTSYSMKFSGNSDSNKLNKFELTYASILVNDEKDLEKLIKDEISEKVYRHISTLEVLEDVADLKEAIFEFNVKNGLSNKLNYINKKKEHIKLLESYLLKSKASQTPLGDIVSRLKKLKDSVFERNEDFVFEYQFWDKEVIEKELKTIKSRILKHEEEISQINSEKKLVVEFFDSSKDLLGL